MSQNKSYRTAPEYSSALPGGMPYIIGNEAAERFSYYGMRAILTVYMTQYLVNASGERAPMSEAEAKGFYHLFVSIVYITPVLGALLADGLLGKYRTILYLSLVYCLGHMALAADDTRTGLFWGQALIALGAGGIKPCVSAHVGDQFGAGNRHLLGKTFGWFYCAINLGAFAAMLIMPWLLEQYGAAVAFAVPGVFMLLATAAFWSGRYQFVHRPPGGVDFVRDTISHAGRNTLLRLGVVYLFVAMFWALFEQTGSSWVLQAQTMDRVLWGYEVLPSQIQAANPLLILLLVPLFSYQVYPALARLGALTPLRKIALGFFVTVLAFVLVSWLQVLLDAGGQPSIAWQLLAYVLLTSAEVMISITCLEFSYTQAPKTMKSLIMAFYFTSVALGNLLTSAVNFFIQNHQGERLLVGADYFWFFSALMLITAILFLFVLKNYPETATAHDEMG